LGVKAEPAWLAVGASTTLSAAVYNPHPDPVTYAWRWCPSRASTEDAFACAIAEDELNAALVAGGYAGVQVRYDLGNAVIADFSSPLPAELLAAACSGHGLGLFVPNCVDGFPVSIGLVVRAGGEEVVAYKTLVVQLDALRPVNLNPRIDAALVGPRDAAREDAIVLEASAPTASVTLSADAELFATVAESMVERYLPRPDAGTPDPGERRETLTLTWFVELGETASVRTGFIEGESTLDDLGHNTWTLPEPESTDAESTQVWLVLRDNRGGLDWLTRTIALARP
jgi:hypothetical protein